jgi:surface antigen
MTARPNDGEISNLIDDINSKITYYQSVRKDATIRIQELMNVKSNLIDTYRS